MLAYLIREIQDGDLELILTAFHWQKREQWQRYFEEHRRGDRVTLIAVQGERVLGYTNLVWASDYEPFRVEDIPEINNMHILDEYQHQGIGTALVHTAEKIAARAGKTHIGIGVAQSPDYAAAQRLYPWLGFEADGRGLKSTQWGEILYSTKAIFPLP